MPKQSKRERQEQELLDKVIAAGKDVHFSTSTMMEGFIFMTLISFFTEEQFKQLYRNFDVIVNNNKRQAVECVLEDTEEVLKGLKPYKFDE